MKAILAAAVLGAAVLGTTPAAGASVASPPDRAACAAVYHFHHVTVTPRLYQDPPVYWNADNRALAAAYQASPAVAGVIVHYVNEGDGWSWVRAECKR